MGTDEAVVIALADVTSKIELLLDKHDELAENVSKIKEAVYNPDSGLFARLRELEVRIRLMEDWKATNLRILWIVITSIVGLTAATGWKVLF